MSYVFILIGIAVGSLLTFLIGRLAESRSNQKEVATRLVDLLDDHWKWLHTGEGAKTDTMREMTVWLPRLTRKKLKERIRLALRQGTIVYSVKGKREIGEQAEMEAMLWQEFTEIKEQLGRYWR